MASIFATDNKRKRSFNSSVIEEAYSSMMSRVETYLGIGQALLKYFKAKNG